MFITRRSLSRRTFLRGVGTTLALPMLDAMVPALSAQTARPPRLGFVYVPNGVIPEQWDPATVGAGFELPPILAPLASVRQHINVLSGLAHLEANTKGDGTGDHPRASAAWLSGVHAYDRSRPGVEVRLATTADQLAARVIGQDTRLASIELSVEIPSQGACDSGDCFYVETVSWRNETTPNLTEVHPRLVFERLFGAGGSAAARQARAQETGSILDSVSQEVSRLARTLGPGDRSKLTEYVDAVRDIERRIQTAETRQSDAFELPERPVGIPDSFEEHIKLMYDLQVLAFQADVTRVFSLVVGRELSSRTYPEIGVPEPHHPVSHHRNDADLIVKKAKIDTYHVQLLTYFLEKMQATQDGEGSLLDSSLIMYGGGMGDGNLHGHTNLPCLLAGTLGGKFRTGYHVAYPRDTPMTNLLLTILDKVGVHIDRLGDSTGRIQPDTLSAA
jgi:hypothetical protein